MTKKCMEENCSNSATHMLPIILTDRTEIYHFCELHYEDAVKQLNEVREGINKLTDKEAVERLKDMFTPEEFNKLMEQIDRPERIYVN